MPKKSSLKSVLDSTKHVFTIDSDWSVYWLETQESHSKFYDLISKLEPFEEIRFAPRDVSGHEAVIVIAKKDTLYFAIHIKDFDLISAVGLHGFKIDSTTRPILYKAVSVIGSRLLFNRDVNDDFFLPDGWHDAPDGSQVHIKDGYLHNEEGPSFITADGVRIFCYRGMKHRNNGAAIKKKNGIEFWYQFDQLHRDNDLPAVIWSNGDKEWWKNGKLHRIDAPAVIESNGNEEWWENGKLTRIVSVEDKEEKEVDRLRHKTDNATVFASPTDVLNYMDILMLTFIIMLIIAADFTKNAFISSIVIVLMGYLTSKVVNKKVFIV